MTQYQYDPLDRLSQVTYADGSTTTYMYDLGDRLTQIVDAIGATSTQITRGYDGLDRLTSETTPDGSVSYTYDTDGRRATMTASGQPQVTYAYDDAHRLTSISQGTNVVGFTYDNADRRRTLTYANGIVATYGYDDANQLTNLIYTLGQTNLGTLTYTYDAVGNRTSVGGNWARTSLPSTLAGAAYDAANRVLTWAGATYSYDLNGNLTSDGSNSYTWNVRNQLVQLSGFGTASFQYDGVARRREKTANGSATRFLYDGLNFVQEQTGAGIATANLLAGFGVDETLVRTEGSGATTLLRDALGSTVAVADAAGAIATSLAYEPYGTTAVMGTPSTSAMQYTGRENDLTGFYYYRARYYQPGTERFIAEDPLGLKAGVNQYAYVHDNPVNKIDPLGLDTFMCMQPLHALGGSGTRSGPDFWGNPLYHQFLCVPDGHGGYICGGQDRSGSGGPWGSPGKPSDDKWPSNPDKSCDRRDNRKCVDDCVARRILNPTRPWYAIGPLGTDCQEWSRDVLRDCQKECRGK